MNKLLEFYRALKRDAFLEYAKEAVSFTDDESRMDAEIEAALAGPSEEIKKETLAWINGKEPTLRFIAENNKSQDAQYHAKRDLYFFGQIRAVILGHAGEGEKQ